jgi:fucose 4-O-acetylase-like acetyltransferase
MTLRENNLDFLKGIAIILVVVGHTIQYRTNINDFDSVFLFRFIYSFHMPFFLFLSGAVASYWASFFINEADLKIKIKFYFVRLRKSFVRLIIPFISWTIIKYYMHAIGIGLFFYIVDSFKHPQISLWFLIAIFECIFIYLTVCIFLSFLDKNNSIYIAINSMNKIEYSILFLFLFLFIFKFFPYYFFYFIFGVTSYRYLNNFKSIYLKVIPLLCFIVLVPSWYRLEINNYKNIATGNIFGGFFPYVVAIAGLLSVLFIAEFVKKIIPKLVIKGIENIGKMSLGIYAIHIYFLEWWPIVIAPLSISFILTMIGVHVSVIKTFLFGVHK